MTLFLIFFTLCDATARVIAELLYYKAKESVHQRTLYIGNAYEIERGRYTKSLPAHPGKIVSTRYLRQMKLQFCTIKYFSVFLSAYIKLQILCNNLTRRNNIEK